MEFWNVVSGGIVSSMTTLVADPVPEFVYVIVYMMVSLGSAYSTSATLVTVMIGAVVNVTA